MHIYIRSDIETHLDFSVSVAIGIMQRFVDLSSDYVVTTANANVNGYSKQNENRERRESPAETSIVI